jgi:4-amino-4-deoxy-L-arabinose transferase-like glycosyltransferase
MQRMLTLVLAVALVLRTACVLFVHNGQYSDSVWYDATARHLASAGEYGPGWASAWFPPGYSCFLAAVYTTFGPSELAGKLANLCLGMAACALTYVVGRTIAGERVGLVAALLLALWPNVIFHTAVLSSEPLATAGFVLAFWLGTTLPEGGPALSLRGVLLGIVVAWAVMTRPVAIIVLVAVWWDRWLAWHSCARSLRASAPAAAVVVLVVGGWTLRNYIQFGQWIPIATNGGYNFWQANHRYADGNDTFWATVPGDDAEYVTMRDGDEFTKNREGYRYGREYILAHPDRWLALAPKKVFWLYHTDTSGLYEAVLHAPQTAPSAFADWVMANRRAVESFTFRYYQAVLVLAALAAVLAAAPSRRRLLPLLALPVLLAAFHMLFHAKDRFHVPLTPFLAVLAAVSVCAAAKRLRGIIGWRAVRQDGEPAPNARSL